MAPSPTFANLPAEKRDRIVELAIEEFSERSYRAASLSRIVARAGIAKGSIYQYFEDKLDLYRWLLLEEVPRRKRAYLTEGRRRHDPHTLTEVLGEIVLSGLEFVRDNPRLVQIGMAATQPATEPALRELSNEARRVGHEGFVAVLADLRARGELRDDIDLDLVARVLAAVLGHGLRELLLGQLGIDVATLMTDPRAALGLTRRRLRPVVDATVRLLVDGIGSR